MIRSLLLSISLLLAGTASSAVLNVPFEKQSQTNWCWAAVSTMTINYMRARAGDNQQVAQCKIATRFNNVDSDTSFCCKSRNASSTRCNQPGSIYKPLDHLGYMRDQVNGQLTDSRFSTLINQLSNKFPVPAAIKWSGQDVGHAILVYGLGFGGIAGGQAIYIYDPTTGKQVGFQNKDALNGYGSANNGAWRAMYIIKQRN